MGGSRQLPWQAGMWEMVERGVGMIVSTRPSLSLACLSLSWWPGSHTQKGSCQTPRNKPLPMWRGTKLDEDRRAGPWRGWEKAHVFPPDGWHPAPKTSVNNGIRRQGSHTKIFVVSPQRPLLALRLFHDYLLENTKRFLCYLLLNRVQCWYFLACYQVIRQTDTSILTNLTSVTFTTISQKIKYDIQKGCSESTPSQSTIIASECLFIA